MQQVLEVIHIKSDVSHFHISREVIIEGEAELGFELLWEVSES